MFQDFSQNFYQPEILQSVIINKESQISTLNIPTEFFKEFLENRLTEFFQIGILSVLLLTVFILVFSFFVMAYYDCRLKWANQEVTFIRVCNLLEP